jgi:predicted MFS family arabinose efflux permease
MPITAAVLPFAGMALDRFGVRRVAFASTLCMSACFVWLSLMNGSLWMFYAAFIALNVLGCATGPIGYTRTIAFRFRRSRGTALAIALMGIGLAGVILPPLLTRVFAGWGWRGAYLFYAAAALVAGLAAMWLMREPRTTAQQAVATTGDTVSQALRRPAFWLLGIAIFLVSVSSLGFVSQFQSIMIEKGLEPKLAPMLLSTLAASVFLSRLLVGWGLDALTPEWVAAGALLLAATGTLVWLVGGPSIAVAMTAVLLLGLSIGAELDLMSFFCARIFGMKHYGSVYGALAFFFYTGIAAGGISYGAIHDRTGSYNTAIILSSCLFVLSAGLFIALRSTGKGLGAAEGLMPDSAS